MVTNRTLMETEQNTHGNEQNTDGNKQNTHGNEQNADGNKQNTQTETRHLKVNSEVKAEQQQRSNGNNRLHSASHRWEGRRSY